MLRAGLLWRCSEFCIQASSVFSIYHRRFEHIRSTCVHIPTSLYCILSVFPRSASIYRHHFTPSIHQQPPYTDITLHPKTHISDLECSELHILAAFLAFPLTCFHIPTPLYTLNTLPISIYRHHCTQQNLHIPRVLRTAYICRCHDPLHIVS